jgi:uncharacterized repeat protein (TIGR01451 family)
MAKSADPTTVDAVGQVVTYTFHVTNTGNVTLTEVTIDETAFSGSGAPPVAICPPGPLAPGDSVDCTATYTVTQADIDSGSIANTAVATATPPGEGTPPVSPPSSAAVEAAHTPALTMVKSADPATVNAAGQVVTYTFHVTNTGNVTLTAVTVDETTFSGTGSAPTPACSPGPLAPGASVDCTATYTVTQADIDGGSIANTATASATGPGDEAVETPPSSATVDAPRTAAMTVRKTANPTMVTAAGQLITYSFTVTNTGNVTLTGVTVTDTMPGLSAVTCPTTTLAPSTSMTCTATYTTTEADVVRGSIMNVATAFAMQPDGDPMVGVEALAVVQVAPVAPPSPITPVPVPVTG